MFIKYLQTIGLEKLIDQIDKFLLNNFVQEEFNKTKTDFTDEEIKKLYIYEIPKLSPDGSCSILEEKNDTPYNLALAYGFKFNPDDLRTNTHTLRLWRLNKITKKIYDQTKVDWFGIYRKLKKPQERLVLAKEAYLGIFSRPEFPLTSEFAKKSNNSTVGLTGKAIVIQDVFAHKGTYYKCDGKVQSEFCVPILNKEDKVIGIIDAESTPKNFNTDERQLQIAKVAFDLGIINLGF